jgi:hypothetical protein
MAVRLYNYATKTVGADQYVGAVLSVETRSVQIMSDVWGTGKFALVWDATEGRPKSLCLATWEWQPDAEELQSSAEVDATDEVRAAYEEYLVNLEVDRRMDALTNEAHMVTKGRTVKVVKGRQGKGTVGPVVVEIVRPYNMGWRTSPRTKVAIATSDVMVDVAGANGKVYKNYRDLVWAWAMNCEVVNPVLPNRDEILAEVLAERQKYRKAA